MTNSFLQNFHLLKILHVLQTKKSSFIFFLLLLHILAGCQPKIVGQGPWVKKIDSEELSRLVTNFATEMKIDKHLELEDSSVIYNDYINRMCLSFSSQRLLTVYDARLLLVELVEELLHRINNDEILSYELHTFPMTADNLDIKINFESFFGHYIDEQYVGLIHLKKGCSHFYAFTNKHISLVGIDWKKSRSEPYGKSRELALLKREADLPFISIEEAGEGFETPEKDNFKILNL